MPKHKPTLEKDKVNGGRVFYRTPGRRNDSIFTDHASRDYQQAFEHYMHTELGSPDALRALRRLRDTPTVGDDAGDDGWEADEETEETYQEPATCLRSL